MAAAVSVQKSDLGVRTLSGMVMLAIAGGALWMGGWWFIALVAAIGIGVLGEWRALTRAIGPSPAARLLWMLAGVLYVGAACYSLIRLDPMFVLIPIIGVIGTDVGAYFAGRAIGGPKIAPAISPSKTWAGLGGGIIGATLALSVIFMATVAPSWSSLPAVLLTFAKIGLPLAVLAQAGDFFESWMKRRAGVKDSGSIIPGHGGLFDRVDGLLPVAIASPLFIAMLVGQTRF